MFDGEIVQICIFRGQSCGFQLSFCPLLKQLVPKGSVIAEEVAFRALLINVAELIAIRTVEE